MDGLGNYVGKFSLPRGGLTIYLVFCTIMASFDIHWEYKDNNSSDVETVRLEPKVPN